MSKLYQDSDDDEHEETQEEFLERYAKAAIDLEDSLAVEEGDLENEDLELDLGKFCVLLVSCAKTLMVLVRNLIYLKCFTTLIVQITYNGIPLSYI